MNSSEKYKGIALDSVSSKVFDRIILFFIYNNFVFGVKKKKQKQKYKNWYNGVTREKGIEWRWGKAMDIKRGG